MALALPLAAPATGLRVPSWAAGAACLAVTVTALAGLVRDAAAAEELALDPGGPVAVRVVHAPAVAGPGAVTVTNTGDRALRWRWAPGTTGGAATAAGDAWVPASGRCVAGPSPGDVRVGAGVLAAAPLHPGAAAVLCVPRAVVEVRVAATPA